MLWNQGIHTDREVTAVRPDVIIKNKKEKTCILIDIIDDVDRSVVQKEVEKKLKYKSLCKGIKQAKIQEFMFRDKMNVEHTMYDYTSSNWSHWNSNKRFKGKSGSHTRKTFHRFTKKTFIHCTSHIIQKVLQTET